MSVASKSFKIKHYINYIAVALFTVIFTFMSFTVSMTSSTIKNRYCCNACCIFKHCGRFFG